MSKTLDTAHLSDAMAATRLSSVTDHPGRGPSTLLRQLFEHCLGPSSCRRVLHVSEPAFGEQIRDRNEARDISRLQQP